MKMLELLAVKQSLSFVVVIVVIVVVVVVVVVVVCHCSCYSCCSCCCFGKPNRPIKYFINCCLKEGRDKEGDLRGERRVFQKGEKL